MFLLLPAVTNIIKSKLNEQKCYKTTRTTWSLSTALRWIAEAKSISWARGVRPAQMENGSLDFLVHFAGHEVFLCIQNSVINLLFA